MIDFIMEKFHIVDNFLDENEISIVINYLNNNKWLYGHRSGDKEEKLENVFFVSLQNNKNITDIVISKLINLLYLKVNIKRSYFHIQTFGLDGSYHIDDATENAYTFCLYISDENNSLIDNHGGEFLLKVPNINHIISIDTLMNRGIFFPSNYLHKGMAYDRFLNNKRICLTWKLIIE